MLSFRGTYLFSFFVLFLRSISSFDARRKEITMQRKKAAEERQRLEEAKAKVHTLVFLLPYYLTSGNRWEQGKLQGYAGRQEGAKR